MKPGSIILNWRQEGNLRKGTVLNSLEEKVRKVSVSRQGHDHWFLKLWLSASCGCSAERGQSQLWHLHQDADRPQEALHMSLASQEYGWKLALTWQCKVACKLEDLGIHHKIWWELWLHPPYDTDLAPSDFHQFRALKDATLIQSLRHVVVIHPEPGYMTWTGHGTDKAYTHFFLIGSRP